MQAIMQFVQHALARSSPENGLTRQCVAGTEHGVLGFECWLMQLAPHASWEGCQDEREHVLVVMAGFGKLLLAGAPLRFASPCTLVLPPSTEYRLVNQGVQPLQWLSVQGTPHISTLGSPEPFREQAP
jgi:mannose-6-phosphate isomerase-like protein (cupin superfamily)